MSSRKCVILYGSQTGTSQEVAERIWREAKCLYFRGPILPMDEYDVSQLIYERLIIFVCSTTGQGEQPDNMKKFWRFLLRKNLPNTSLIKVRFAVLGLGDSSYSKFNHVAKKLHRRLMGLGGLPLCEVGLADDQHDLGADAIIDPWIQHLWTVLADLCPLPAGTEALHHDTCPPPPRWMVTVSGSRGDGELPISNGPTRWEQHPDMDRACISTVIENTRITSTQHFQDVRLIRLATENTIHYTPGDVVMVRPCNSVSAVNHLFGLLAERSDRLGPNCVLQVKQSDPDMPVPVPLQRPATMQLLATHYWDLNAVPRRYTFQLLSHFTRSELEADKLRELASAAGQEELFSYCNRPRRSVLEVLTDFPHATDNLPPDYLFEVLQPIRHRAFSIASSPTADEGELHILVAVVKYRTKLMAPRLGLCSNWLASLQPDQRIHIHIRSGSFTFPRGAQAKPMVMVGPGTGVAPFRSLIREREATGTAGKDLLHLFFGCRNRLGDFHCCSEWEKLEAQGQLSLYTAFSRDQPHKIYVQHLLKQESKQLWGLLSDMEGCFYVAGSSKDMPTDVRQALIELCAEEAQCDTLQAQQFVEKLEAMGRYQTETWA